MEILDLIIDFRNEITTCQNKLESVHGDEFIFYSYKLCAIDEILERIVESIFSSPYDIVQQLLIWYSLMLHNSKTKYDKMMYQAGIEILTKIDKEIL